jgi:hypothetical protein
VKRTAPHRQPPVSGSDGLLGGCAGTREGYRRYVRPQSGVSGGSGGHHPAVVPPAASLHHELLLLARRPDGVLVAQAADELALTRGAAAGRLRRLEREGLIAGHLAGGGRLRYESTAAGDAALAAFERAATARILAPPARG